MNKMWVNGEQRVLLDNDSRVLANVLRDEYGHFEVKVGCAEGVCGSCTVLVDGGPQAACLLLTAQVQDCHIETARRQPDELYKKLSDAFIRHEAAQCGYCTPGMLLSAYHFLRNADGQISSDLIRHALAGNLCRCTGYQHIVDAVEEVGREGW